MSRNECFTLHASLHFCARTHVHKLTHTQTHIHIHAHNLQAVGGAKLAGIDLFEHFSFTNPESYLTAALTGFLLLAAYDTVLLGVPW
jgi:hypothetical protein